MKPTILLTTIAASAALFTHPLQAKPDQRDGDGRGAPARTAPPAAHAQAPRVQAMHSQAVSRPQFAQAPSQRVAPQHFNNQQRVDTGVAMANNRSIQNDRSIQNNRRGPTVAMGGTNNYGNNWRSNNNVNNNWRTDNRAQSFSRTNNFRPPVDVYRGWDHNNVHTWNHHSYRWYNNDWIVIDGGYGYPGYYDGGYDYDAPYTYSYAPPVTDYGTNLTAEVQEELSRRGYSTGGVDGVIGAQTRNAIAGFQEDNGLPVTGRIDTRLVRSLGL